MSIGRNLRNTLERKADADGVAQRMRCKETVVIAAPSSQAMAGSVERHTRDKGNINGIVVDEAFTRRFLNVKSALAQIVSGGVATQLHRIVARHTG